MDGMEEGEEGELFWFTFFLLGLHIVPLRQQAINETSRSFPEKDAYRATKREQTHALTLTHLTLRETHFNFLLELLGDHSWPLENSE